MCLHYRLGLQETLKCGLTVIGSDEQPAIAISINSSSILFGMAHSQNFSEEFSTTAISGFVFGVIQETYSFPFSVVTHMTHNIPINLDAPARAYHLAHRTLLA